MESLLEAGGAVDAIPAVPGRDLEAVRRRQGALVGRDAWKIYKWTFTYDVRTEGWWGFAQNQTRVLIGCVKATVTRGETGVENPDNFANVIGEWSLSR